MTRAPGALPRRRNFAALRLVGKKTFGELKKLAEAAAAESDRLNNRPKRRPKPRLVEADKD
jgi:hypothetical protein